MDSCSASSELDLPVSTSTDETDSIIMPSSSHSKGEDEDRVAEFVDKIIESSQKNAPKRSERSKHSHTPKSRKRAAESKPHKNKKRAKKTTETTRDRLKSMNNDYASENFGLWIQCCKKDCGKWRWVSEYEEDYQVPEKWYCSSNNDQTRNDCCVKEALLPSEKYSLCVYQPGSIVWAHVIGYPSWPSIVEDDPDCLEFYDEIYEHHVGKVARYHVTFFGNEVSRAWVPDHNIRRFQLNHKLPPLLGKQERFKLSLKIAFADACRAMDIPMKDRLLSYGFAIRFNGRYPTVKDLSSDSESEENLLQSTLNETRNLMDEVDALDDDFHDILTDDEDDKFPDSDRGNKKFHGTVKPASNPKKKGTKRIEKCKKVSKEGKGGNVEEQGTKCFNKKDVLLKQKERVEMNLKKKSDFVARKGKRTKLQDSSLNDDTDIEVDSSNNIAVAPLEENVTQNKKKGSIDLTSNSLWEDFSNDNDKENNDDDQEIGSDEENDQLEKGSENDNQGIDDGKDDSDQEVDNAKANDQGRDHDMKITASTKVAVARGKCDNEGSYNEIETNEDEQKIGAAAEPVMTIEEKSVDQVLYSTSEQAVTEESVKMCELEVDNDHQKTNDAAEAVMISEEKTDDEVFNSTSEQAVAEESVPRSELKVYSDDQKMDEAAEAVITNEEETDDQVSNATSKQAVTEESVKNSGIDGKITKKSENKDKAKRKTKWSELKNQVKKRKIAASTGNLEGSDFKESFEKSVNALEKLEITGSDEKSARNKKMKINEPPDFKKPDDKKVKSKTALIDSMSNDNNSVNNEKTTTERFQMEKNVKASSEKDDDKCCDTKREDECKIDENENCLQLEKADAPEVCKEVYAGKSNTETETRLKGTAKEKKIISKIDVREKSGQKMADVEYDTKVGGNEKKTKKEKDASLKTDAKMKKEKKQKSTSFSITSEGKVSKEMKQKDDLNGKQNEVPNVKGEMKPKKSKKDETNLGNKSKPKIDHKQDSLIKEVENSKFKDLPKLEGKKEESKKDKSVPEVPSVKEEMKPKKSKKDETNLGNKSKPKIDHKQDSLIKEVENSKFKDLPKLEGKKEESKKDKSVPEVPSVKEEMKPKKSKKDETNLGNKSKPKIDHKQDSLIKEVENSKFKDLPKLQVKKEESKKDKSVPEVPSVKEEMKPKKSKKDQTNLGSKSKLEITDKEVEKSKFKDLPKLEGKKKETKEEKSVPDFTRRNKLFKPPVMKSDSTVTSKNMDINQVIASKRPELSPTKPINVQTNRILPTDNDTGFYYFNNEHEYGFDQLLKKDVIKDDVKDKQVKIRPLEEHLLDLNDINPISMDGDLGLYFSGDEDSVPFKETAKKDEKLSTGEQKCKDSTSFNLLESDFPTGVSSILYHSDSENSNPFDYD